MIYFPSKAPGASEDFAFDFAAGDEPALQAGEGIASYNLSVTGTASISNASKSGGKIAFTLSGGDFGVPAVVTCTVTTDSVPPRTYVETGIVPIGEEPVSLAEAKEHLGVLDSSRDRLILGYISAARRYCENYSGHVFVRRTFTEAFERWGNYIEISKRPIVSVDSITYTDATGADADFTAFTTSVGRTPLRIYATTPPTLGMNGNIRVSYTAGYDEGYMPEEARQAILMLVAHWFAQRESVNVVNGLNPTEVPLATSALLDSFKAMVA